MRGSGRAAAISVALAILASPAAAVADGFDADAYLDRALAALRAKHMNAGRVDWPRVEAAARRRPAPIPKPDAAC